MAVYQESNKVMAINNILLIISTYSYGNKITEELNTGPK